MKNLKSVQTDSINLQNKARSRNQQPEKAEVEEIMKRRQLLGKIMGRKRQAYNLITSEYIHFCFSMNTILTTFCFLAIFINYVRTNTDK
jgi:hypothetical protein